MEGVIFVEVLGRRGELMRRERVERLPLRIGRGYDNDLILEDPHVCAAHAVLDREDGALRLRDLGSVNGIRTLPGRTRVASVAIASGSSVLLGRTQLRILDPQHPVPAAHPLLSRPAWLEWLVTRPAAGLLWLALLLGVSVLDLVRSSIEEIDWASQAAQLAGLALLVAAWAGAFALVGRLLGQRPRFVAHLAIAVCAMLFTRFQATVFEWGQFLFGAVQPQRVVDMTAGGFLFGAVLFAHLSVLHVARTARRALIAAAFGVLLLGFRLSTLFSTPIDWIAVLPYWSRLEPLDPRWLPVRRADAFFAEVATLEDELIELREEALEEE